MKQQTEQTDLLKRIYGTLKNWHEKTRKTFSRSSTTKISISFKTIHTSVLVLTSLI